MKMLIPLLKESRYLMIRQPLAACNGGGFAGTRVSSPDNNDILHS
jgi:hypothetical protein